MGRICKHPTAPTAAAPSRLDFVPPCAYINSMDRAAAPAPPSLRDLLLRSDMGRANPARVDELLDRAADPTTELRNTPRRAFDSVD